MFVSPLAEEEEEEEETVVIAEDIIVEDIIVETDEEPASTTTPIPEDIDLDSSELSCPSRLSKSYDIDDMATMYYALVPPQPEDARNGILCVRIEDEGTDPYNWMGFGISSIPHEVANSEAVIGVPLNEGEDAVLKYEVEEEDIGPTVSAMRKRRQTLRDASIDMIDDPATGKYLLSEMSFTKFIDEFGETDIVPEGTSYFYYARGRGQEIGEHYPIITFEIDFGATAAPISAAPISAAPISAAPTSAAPTSASPTSAAPTSASPTTIDPPLLLVEVDGEAEAAPEAIEEESTSSPADTEEEPPSDGKIVITKVLEPEADTWIENSEPDTNFGIRQRLKVDKSPVRATLLRFDTSPLSNFISQYEPLEAQLWMYSLTETPYGGRVEVLENCTDWDENLITWSNAPACALILGSGSAGSLGENVEEQSWNRAALDLDLANLPGLITLRITSDNPDGVTYASRENATAVPKLVVTFTDIEETVSAV